MEDEARSEGYHQCRWVSNDHPPMCMHGINFPCRECENYIDGLTDLLPYEGEWTENQYEMMELYRQRDTLYHHIHYGKVLARVKLSRERRFQQISDLSTIINQVVRKVREERR